MIVTKLIEIGLNIQDPIGIYTDLDNNVMNLLVDRYKNKCIRGCYITDINKIVKMSECVINQDGNANFGTMNVIFEATAVMYNVGEIIVGCTVRSKDKNGLVVLSTDYADIILSADKRLESISKDQQIMVRVDGVRYTLGAPKVAIKASSAFISKIPIIYKITIPISTLTIDNVSDLISKIATVEDEIVEIKATNATAWEFFDQLLYAYKDKQADPAGATKVDLLDFINTNAEVTTTQTLYVSRDARINLTTPSIYVYDTKETLPSNHHLVSILPTENVLVELLDNYYSFVRLVLDNINVYNTQKLLDSHKNLWVIYKDAKTRE